MVSRLHGKVALVTGGASGLGQAIAQRLSDEGASVIISDIQAELGQASASSGGFAFLQQDVCDEQQWHEIVGKSEERYGRLDVLVNNAGILGSMASVSPENTSLEDWRRIFAVNVEGVFLGCRSAIAAMRRAGGGSIVNLSSIGALQATPFATAYGASKAAVRQLSQSIARHCAEARMNIRCNSVHPGVILTPLWLKMADELASARGITTGQLIDEERAAIPMGDFTRAEDIAAAVAFLASEDARHVTGAALVVDGGIIHCK